ncbi:MAG: DUF1573 domain-containing protein [Bacteroidales bacterium]|nr:DUF1573 domain-containing protein [Bacteroidales bacterium]
MRKLLKIRRLLAVVVIGLCVLTACEEKTDGKLSTDLVTSPKSATETSDKQAAIKFDKEEHDFGTLLQGEVVSYSFHFTNVGNMPLIVSEVGSSCGCTVGDYPREPIAPGKTGSIKVTYNSAGHHGFQSRYLTVMTNTNPAKTTLRIKGKVLTPDQY